MWNDADAPIAYLITFRTYGTWLHGDTRGSIDRHNNKYGSPKYGFVERWTDISKARMKFEPVYLNFERRSCVYKAIRETCELRKWGLLAANVRTNHAHVVSAIGSNHPSQALNAFKANATRIMREEGYWPFPRSPWADKGSERWLWTEKHVADAIEYVLRGQGGDLPSEI